MVDRLMEMELCLAVEMTMEIGCSNQVLDSNYKDKSGRRFLEEPIEGQDPSAVTRVHPIPPQLEASFHAPSEQQTGME